MSLLAITAQKIITPLETIERGTVLIEDGSIRAAGPAGSFPVPPRARLMDLGERVLAPGFIDVHIHGGAGHDVMEGTPEALDAVARNILGHGTTSFVPTTLSAPPQLLCKSLEGLHRTLQNWRRPDGVPCAEPLGIHLEGPFLSPERRGAHPRRYVQKPSVQLLDQLINAAGGAARILTLAPELEGAAELQRHASGRGVRVAMGHSNATYPEAMRAIDGGCIHAVHVFNAMRPFGHRDPGIVGAVLTDDRVFAELIADGVHVEAAAMRLLVRAKGAARTVLVTDAVSATGMGPGRYLLGDMELLVSPDPTTGAPVCRNREGALAGSVLSQDEALRNIMAAAAISLADALRMASYNPACLLGIEDRKGVILPGADADLVVLQNDGQVAGAIVAGRLTSSLEGL